MTSPHAHLPPTLLENQQAQTPYAHQGAYAIRRKQSPSPTAPVDQAVPGTGRLQDIPDSVRKSYVAQKLPIRQQSLAAAYHHGKAVTPIQEESNKLNRAQTQYAAQPTTKNGFARSATIASSVSKQNQQRLRNLPKRTSSIMNLSLRKEHPLDAPLPPPPPLPPTLPKISTTPAVEDEDAEEEDFNFRDRPPSSAPKIVPVVATDSLSIFSPETPINHQPFNFPLPDLPPIDTEKRRPSEAYSVDTTTTVETSPERRRSSVKHSDVKMLHSRSDSTVTTLSRPGMEGGRRRSCDTEMSDSAELSSPSPRGERTSIFLRMQQKREEQRKSIYAYRTPKYQGRQPTIQAALLSNVAKEFYRRIPTIPTLVKDNIEYHNVFSGRDAVDRLVSILRTNDRNIAVAIGRALDAQNFFHDVNYEHRLRDTIEELYQFRGELGASLGLPSSDVVGDTAMERPRVNEEEIEFPTGVFTLLTDCYSPTCSSENPCYSFSCPRLASRDLKRSQSQSSLRDSETHDLWIHSVPEEVVKNTPPEERKRQECIYEFIRTEQDFVKDLQYVHNFWVKPLITSDIIPSERREHFVQEVFWNMADIEKVNSQLAQALIARQKEQAVVTNIGDIMLEYMCEFHPFVAYGAHQIIGKFYFELEKKRNPQFAQFVEETERKPESRRLELNGYLTKPTTRLGRYNLLLREILKRTPPDNPDYELIPQIMELITEFLVQVNAEAGKCENTFSLQQIEERLSFKASTDYVDLKLKEPGRQLVMKGRMSRKGNSSSDASDLQVFLFDNYLVFAKIKTYNFLEYYRVYRKPIPLELLSVSVPGNNRNKRASSILPYSRSATLISTSSSITPKSSTSETLQSSSKSSTFPIIFYHHGRKGSPPLTLYASGSSTRKAWVEKIKEMQEILAEKQRVFSIHPLLSRQFQLNNNKINSSKCFYADGQRKILIGADQGVYVSEAPSDEESIKARRIVSIDKVSQIDLVDNTQLLVLADKTLWAFPLESFEGEGEVAVKRFRPISQHAVLFHVGECMGKTLVCVVKTNTLTPTTIRVLEPVVAEEDKKSRRAFIKRLVRTGPANLKPFKDLYLPSEASSISLLKTKMCVTCPQEIGVIDMKTFEVQALLDPDDEELSFVFSRQDLRPITIYRIQFAEYLVCYNEFAFFVDQRGRLKNPNRRIDWEGMPDSFALYYPYILAFEPEVIEIHNILTGTLDQRIRGTHIRCTSSSNGTIQVAMADPDNEGYHLLAQLDLVKENIDYLPPPIQFSTASFSM